MNKIKNFFMWFFATLGIAAFVLLLYMLFFYLLEQSWGLIVIIFLFAICAGIAGVLKGE